MCWNKALLLTSGKRQDVEGLPGPVCEWLGWKAVEFKLYSVYNGQALNFPSKMLAS